MASYSQASRVILLDDDSDYSSDLDSSSHLQDVIQDQSFEGLLRSLCSSEFHIKEFSVDLESSLPTMKWLEFLIDRYIDEYSERVKEHMVKDILSIECNEGTYGILSYSSSYIEIIENLIYAQCVIEEIAQEITKAYRVLLQQNYQYEINVNHNLDRCVKRFQLIVFSEKRLKELLDHLTSEFLVREDRSPTYRSISSQLKKIYSYLLKSDCPMKLKYYSNDSKRHHSESTDYSQYDELEELFHERLLSEQKLRQLDCIDGVQLERERERLLQKERECLQQRKRYRCQNWPDQGINVHDSPVSVGQLDSSTMQRLVQSQKPDLIQINARLTTLIKQINRDRSFTNTTTTKRKRNKRKGKLNMELDEAVSQVSAPTTAKCEKTNKPTKPSQKNPNRQVECDEIKEFEKRLEASATSQQKLKPNISQEWIKRLTLLMHKKLQKKQTFLT